MGATARETWEEILDGIRARVPEGQFRTWFAPIGGVALEADRLTLRVPNEYFREWLGREYRHVIEEAARSVMGARPQIVFAVDAGLRVAEDGTPGTLDTLGAPERLNPDCTFEAFVVGPSTSLAHRACLEVARDPGGTYNPLYLHGPSGTGKSHLLQALCHTLLKDRRGWRVVYASCEGFVNEFMSALRERRLASFRARCRRADALLVDDVQFLARTESSQEEFFHTFNALYNARRQVVICADAPPDRLEGIEKRLLSRFRSGLVAGLDRPDFETRMSILRRKSQARGHHVPEEVLRFIAERGTDSVRELEGALIRVLAHASLLDRPLDLAVARKALGSAVGAVTSIPLPALAARVAAYYNVGVEDLISRSRRRSVAFPRQVFMYLARRMTPHSLEEIGRFLGGRDHSTVLHGVEKVQHLIEAEQEARESVLRLAHEIQTHEPQHRR